MPNRILRDCTDSEKINMLDGLSERFFYRLIMIVDDYGRFYAHPGLLRAEMFPFQLNKVKDSDISKWLLNCVSSGLVIVYKIGSKEYLQVHDFRQRLDRAKEKFPPPQINSKTNTNDPREVVIDFPPETEAEAEVETETQTQTEAEADGKIPPARDRVIFYFIERNSNQLEAELFYDYYQANGWVVTKAKTKMKDWRASVRNWLRRAGEFDKPQSRIKSLRDKTSADYERERLEREKYIDQMSMKKI